MKKFLSLLFISMIGFQIFAVPANSEPVTVTQPNGEEITLIMRGDEFINWAETLDGYTLLANSEYYWCYAQLNDAGDLEPSPYIATDFSNRSSEVTEWLQNIDKNLFYSEEQVSYYMQFREMVEVEYKRNTNIAEPKGEQRKLLVILMQFPDRPFTKTVKDFEMLFNQINYTGDGNQGSMRDFYLESSYNKFEVICTVVGPYTTQNNATTYIDNGPVFAKEAIQAAVADGINLTPFALPNGQLPSFYAIYAGLDQSQGCKTCIWAHKGNIYPAISLGGVTVSTYAASSELRTSFAISSVAVFCHEYGHTLNAPDYYDTDYGTGGEYDGTGEWDVMAKGTNVNYGKTPPTHNPRTKIYTYTWAKVTLLNTPQTVTIPAGRIYSNAYFRINTPKSNEYFIIENKIKEGFDSRIPGKDLLIYKCTDNYENGGNKTSWQRFYPVSANAPVAVPEAGVDKQKQYGSINTSSCTWPGTGNKTTFDNTSIPAMVTWDGTPVNKAITNITVHGDYITFDFMGGGSKSSFHVFLPAYKGCIATALPNSTSPVVKGGSFSFQVDLLQYYTSSKIEVSANGVVLTPSSGNRYTINNITEDQIIRIKGLEYNSVNDITNDYEDKITVYPNPTTGELRITSSELQITDVDIFDISGKKISSQHLTPSSSDHLINISHLQTGFYFVQLQTEYGLITKKVVKE